MTPPLISRLVLVPSSPPQASTSPVRRYRIARLAVNPQAGAEPDGFEHLKRTYD